MMAATRQCRNGLYSGHQSVFLILALIIILAGTLARAVYYENDLTGPFCAKINRCCEQRNDECSVQLNGTKCYCDIFCDRSPNGWDCCPDYWSHCNKTKNDTTPTTPTTMVPQNLCSENSNFQQYDEVELFFKYLTQIMRNFPHHVMVQTKNKIFQIVNQMERSIENTTCID